MRDDSVVAFIRARAGEWERDADRVHDVGCHIHPGFADERDECNCGEPARVLAQVAAMRAIMLEYRNVEGTLTALEESGDDARFDWAEREKALDLVLRHLAAIWSSHADYDPAWAPDA